MPDKFVCLGVFTSFNRRHTFIIGWGPRLRDQQARAATTADPWPGESTGVEGVQGALRRGAGNRHGRASRVRGRGGAAKADGAQDGASVDVLLAEPCVRRTPPPTVDGAGGPAATISRQLRAASMPSSGSG